jgi:hypothetical protein
MPKPQHRTRKSALSITLAWVLTTERGYGREASQLKK